MVFAQLFLMLIIILIAAEVFTNALEHLGEKQLCKNHRIEPLSMTPNKICANFIGLMHDHV